LAQVSVDEYRQLFRSSLKIFFDIEVVMIIENNFNILVDVNNNYNLHVREFFDDECLDIDKRPLILIHGATIASELWVNDHKDVSWCHQLAEKGFRVFTYDSLGFRMSRVENYDHLSISDTRVSNTSVFLDNIISYVQNRTGKRTVDVISCSWGTVVLTKYFSLFKKDKINKAVFFAPIYNDSNAGIYWKSKYDSIPESGGCKIGYVFVEKKNFTKRWDEEIPFNKKTTLRKEKVLDSVIKNTLKNSISIGESFIVPTGPLADLYDIFSGEKVHNPAAINIPSLVIRAEHDLTSTYSSSINFYNEIGSEDKKYLSIPSGSHFAILEKKFSLIFSEVVQFLK